MWDEVGMNLIASGIAALGGSGVTMATRFVLLDSRLTGRWEGELRCDDDVANRSKTHVIRCIMILARPIARENSGFFYYQRECTHKDIIMVRGLDELTKYEKIGRAIRNPEIEMIFTRKFHKEPHGETDDTPAGYRFNCKMNNLLSRAPKMQVSTQIPTYDGKQNNWSGIFQKH